MSYHVDTDSIIKTILEGGAARQLVADIVNGVNTWLFRVLSEYGISPDQAKLQCLRFGRKIFTHLRMTYELERHYYPPEKGKSFKEYLETDLRAVEHGLNYLVKSFKNDFRDNEADYEASVVALLIVAKREEQEFEIFRKGLPETDVRIALVEYYLQNNVQWLGGTGAATKREGLVPKEPFFGARVAFRGFNP